MLRVSVEAAAANLQGLLEQVAKGEEVILVEHEREVARLVPPPSREQWLARTKQFRQSLHVTGKALSTTVMDDRQGERD